MAGETKSERIQLRTSAEAKAQINEAAALTQQDATSFILDAATARARAVLLEHRLLQLSPADLQQIESALKDAAVPPTALIDLFQSTRSRVPEVSR